MAITRQRTGTTMKTTLCSTSRAGIRWEYHPPLLRAEYVQEEITPDEYEDAAAADGTEVPDVPNAPVEFYLSQEEMDIESELALFGRAVSASPPSPDPLLHSNSVSGGDGAKA